MKKTFYQALTEISNGKGLLPLSSFIHRHTVIGEVEIKLGNMIPTAAVTLSYIIII